MKKLINVRLEESTIEKMEELESLYKVSRTKLIDSLISAEYLKTDKGKEQIKAMMDELEKINNLIDTIK